jgi:hypothetical protein
MLDQRILPGEQTNVRIGLLHDAKDGLGRVHADTPALDDPSSRILDKAGKAPLSAMANCSCQGPAAVSCRTRGRAQTRCRVCSRPCVVSCPRSNDARHRPCSRTQRCWEMVSTCVVVRRRLEQLAHLRRQDIAIAALIVKRRPSPYHGDTS